MASTIGDVSNCSALPGELVSSLIKWPETVSPPPRTGSPVEHLAHCRPAGPLEGFDVHRPHLLVGRCPGRDPCSVPELQQASLNGKNPMASSAHDWTNSRLVES